MPPVPRPLVSAIPALALLFLILGTPAPAQELPFPLTRADIVAALSPPPPPQSEEPLLPGAETQPADRIAPSQDQPLPAQMIAAAFISFDPQTGEIASESLPLLDQFGQALANDFPGVLFSIVGHVDGGLPPMEAISLSLERAEAVKAHLVRTFGLDPNLFLIQGYGDMSPLPDPAPGEPDRNNRIEFIRL